ncbi:DNA helicase [Roseobacter phage CRP-235]|nr:DNA helicase [Roseobacter phage CRP-235]
MEAELIKTLLKNDTYQATQAKLRKSIFSDEYEGVYTLLKTAHEKYGSDLKTEDLFSVWRASNPVATASEIADFKDILDGIKRSESITPAVAQDVIESLWRQEIGRDVANIGINMSEGDTSAMMKLQSLLEKVSDSYMPDEFGDPTTDNIYELLAETSDDNRWKFNIETLSRHVYGIGPSEFGIVFARPETGKSAFLISIIAGPGGFCQQGAKVLYLGNEERTTRTKLRAIQACSGMTREQISENPDLAMSKYQAIRDRLIMQDIQEWDLDTINAYCEKVKPDALFIDQADKVTISGNYNSSHERLRELYRSLRELAKRHDCALIGVSQASAEAEGKTRVDFSMLEGSKTGKAAEADLIIGIGKAGSGDDNEPDNRRFINISKNKLSGFHGYVIAMIEPQVSRYVE